MKFGKLTYPLLYSLKMISYQSRSRMKMPSSTKRVRGIRQREREVFIIRF